ncbi:EAL domain-containing protein [Ammoniphilus sp. CFH 90114]|uniref:sensor domain-containing protein n=1 Tax=Ammoniphilus sp. CFH 90114 TaxID=2493665 RepID=UPI00100DD0F4|nr:EAL domain-containing protein [Ammoniphilus sp. CFH 90114]RXT07120.1 EAL domain-containing protein [Ammoniphilus sp. CFH 90114]
MIKDNGSYILEVGEKELWETTETLQALIKSSPLAIVSFDHDGHVNMWNPAAEKLLGWREEEVLNKPNPLFSEDTNADEFSNLLGLLLQGNALTDVEIRRARKDGSTIDLSLSITLLYDKQGDIRGGVALFADITKRKQAELMIKKMAYFDSLTDLPNRTLFYDRLTQAINQAKRTKKPIAVLFLDLDRFKIINDSLGHTAGDQLLQEVSKRLLTCIREGDTVSRQGGDEFTILLANTSSTGAATVAGRIIDMISQPMVLNGHEILVTPSIGIGMFPEDGDNVENLLKNADTAMYHAKDLGKNNYQFYSSKLDQQVLERLTLENELRKALEKKEFVLHYQPLIHINSQKIIGVEALIRWQHPQLGVISPTKFIPLAEETGLIVSIGKWIIQTACAQTKAWQDKGYPPLKVSVNLSGRQFKEPDLVDTICGILKVTGLEPQYLELEITENISMNNVHLTIQTLQELKALGLKISIDDFGTGYSSLNYLKKFPIDTLKIDQSFVRDIHTDRDDAAIVKAIMAMAFSLDLNVIAEGVETQEQLLFLVKQRCPEAQGYYFNKPLTVEEMEDVLMGL